MALDRPVVVEPQHSDHVADVLVRHGAVVCGEPGIFVAFEEAPSRILVNFDTFGWNLRGRAGAG